MKHPFWAPAKVFLGTLAFNIVDFWLWPQFHETATTQSISVDNVTVEIAVTTELGRQNMVDHSNQFWQHFSVDPCFVEGGCGWTAMACTFLAVMSLNICACAYMGDVPRFAMIYTPVLSNATCLFHEFVVRGRYLAPSSTHIYMVFSGSLIGVLTWGCLNFACIDQVQHNRHTNAP